MKPTRRWVAPNENAGKLLEIIIIISAVVVAVCVLILYFINQASPAYLAASVSFFSALVVLVIWNRKRLKDRYDVTQNLLTFFEPAIMGENAFKSKVKDTFPSLPKDLVHGDYDAPRELAQKIEVLPCFTGVIHWYYRVLIFVLKGISWLLKPLTWFLNIICAKLSSNKVNKFFFAIRDWLIKMPRQIRWLSILTHPCLNIITISGSSVSGKTTLIERIASDVSQKPRTEVWLQRRDTELSSGNWRELVEKIKIYANYIRGRKLVFCFDEPFIRMTSTTKNELNFHHPSDVWNNLGNDLKKSPHVVIIITWNYLYSGRDIPSSFTAREPSEDEELIEGQFEQSEERDFKVFNFRLFLTPNDMKKLLGVVARQLNYDEKSVTKFLDSPGNLWRSRHNFPYLVYLFERFYVQSMGTNALEENVEKQSLPYNISQNELRRMLHTRESLSLFDQYSHLEKEDEKKNAILFVTLANLIGLPVPDNILKCGLAQPSIDFLAQEEGGYLIQDVNHDWNVKDAFLSYILLQDEFGQAKDFVDTIEKIMLPWISPLCDSLCSSVRILNGPLFLRDLLHFIAEDKFRPVLSGYGRKAAVKLFAGQRQKVQDYIQNILLKELDTNPSPLTIWEIRRWASTFQRLGFDDEALDLFNLILDKVDSVKTTKTAKGWILIPIANALIRTRSEKMREKAKTIYLRLMGEEFADVPSIHQLALLDEALTSLINNRDERTALQWMNETPIKWQDDMRMWMNRARILENLGYYDDANDCYSCSLELADKFREKKVHYLFQAHQRYAFFIVRHATHISHSIKLPDPLVLLDKAENIAKSIEQYQYLTAVNSTKGQLYRERRNYKLALEFYRKAVEETEKTGIPNSRPYIQLSNFTMDYSESIGAATGELPNVYLAEAERTLKKVVMGEDFDETSKILSFNSLGNLVACNFSKNKSGITYYSDDGKIRPDYKEALTLLENSFISDEETRFNPEKKTWQDIVTHGPVMNILIRLARITLGEQRKAYLLEANKHYKALFEGLPNSYMDDEQVREHVIKALVGYADFVWEWLGQEGIIPRNESIKQAEEYYCLAIKYMEEWGLNSRKFREAWEIYSFYARFLWGVRVKKRCAVNYPNSHKIIDLVKKREIEQYPALPLDTISEDAMLKIVDCNEKCLAILTDRPNIIKPELYSAIRNLLRAYRTLAESAIESENSVNAENWIEKFADLISKGLGSYKMERSKLLPTLNSFKNHRRIDGFLKERDMLRKRIISLYSV